MKTKYELKMNGKFNFGSDNAETMINRYIAEKIMHPNFEWEIVRGGEE